MADLARLQDEIPRTITQEIEGKPLDLTIFPQVYIEFILWVLNVLDLIKI